MNTGSMLALGIMVGVMIAAWILSRKSSKETDYDEMQLKIRADGFRIGFYTALLLLVVLILLLELNTLTAVTPAFAVFTILIASVVVFAVYCILHDAFLAVRGKAKTYIGIFTMIVIIEGAVTIRHLMEKNLLEDGTLTFSGGSSAVMCLGFLALLITLIVKTVRSGKEAEE